MNTMLLGTLVAALLVAVTLLLIPMVPGGLIDTRDFGPLPRWQYRSFNVFLTTLGLVSFVVAGFAVATGSRWTFVAGLVLALLYIAVFGLDLGEVFPVVPDRMPVQLLILEALDLALAGVLLVVSVAALLS